MRVTLAIVSWAVAIILNGCASPTAGVPPQAKHELTPTGPIRVGLNFGNVLLLSKDPATGEPRGLVADVAHELGRQIGAPVQFVPYERPVYLADAADKNEWDIAFLAVEPARAARMNFSPPYVQIEASYLVRLDSQMNSIADVDRSGIRIAVAAGSAYELFLSRTIKNATIMGTKGSANAMKALYAGEADAVANITEVLRSSGALEKDYRVIDGHFMVIEQAIAIPKDKRAAYRYLADFVADLKRRDFVAHSIERNGARGLTPAP